MEWISVKDRLPEIGKRVLFRAVIGWRTGSPDVYFADIITSDKEPLDYGHEASMLEDNTEYLVLTEPNPEEWTDQYVTHWCDGILEFKNH